MMVRSAALLLALAVAGGTIAGGLLAQDQGALPTPPPEPSPTPAPHPTPPPIPPGPTPGPVPTPTPAPSPGRSASATPASGVSTSGTASIVQTFPLDYRSIVDRLQDDPKNA